MQCTSRPDCCCSFCTGARTGQSAKAEQDALARQFMAQLEAKAARIRAQRRAGQIRDAALRRHEPLFHRAHGRLCDLCHFENNKG
jgi:hypothetical protein